VRAGLASLPQVVRHAEELHPLTTSDRNRSSSPDPRRIRSARELRGLTQREVVERMEPAISTAALSQIESGKLRPSLETLLMLAGALRVPIEFFEARSSEALPHITYFRDLRSTTARERRRAGALAFLMSDLIEALERHVRLPRLDLPNHEVAPAGDREAIEEAASMVRSTWGLGDAPIPHVVRELERHGIPVAQLSLGGKQVDAFSTRIGTRPLVILTKDKSNYVRSRFDAAHELGHLVLHARAQPGSKQVETQAHDFASSFLLPEQVARAELPRRLDSMAWGQLAEMKRTWSALLYRARALRLMTVDTHRTAMRYMAARGWRTVEPGDRELGAPEAPLLVQRSIKRAEVEGTASFDSLVREARLPAEDALLLIEASIDDRPVVEL